MKTVNQDAFFNYINSKTLHSLENVIIKLKNNTIINYDEIGFHKSFINCVFLCENLTITGKYENYKNNIYSKKISLEFKKCDFKVQTFQINYSFISAMFFINNINLPEKFILNHSNIQGLSISENINSNAEIQFRNIKIELLTIKKIVSKSVHFSETCDIGYFGLVENKLDTFNLNHSTIKDLAIKDCVFKEVSFSETKIGKCNILNNDFINIITFKNTTFNDTFRIYSTEKPSNANLDIIECDFNNHSFFYKMNINKLRIGMTSFNEIVSFGKITLKSISLESISFKYFAFFDNLNITNIQKCDKKTIRIIKQQYKKTENLIDYYKFKSLELNMFRDDLELEKKYWYNDNDAFILKISSFFSDNGLNWFKSLKKTLYVSAMFYTVFYLIYIFIRINNFKFTPIDLTQLDEFINGYFIFLIPTNFYNPLLNTKEFVVGFEWLPFVIGKIFLAIGIYETIKSFRKFKE